MSATTDPATPGAEGHYVWDGLVRIVHWSVACLFLLDYAVLTEGELIHRLAGYAILTLVSIRLAWGIVGSRYARFSAFPLSLSAAARHAGAVFSGRTERHLSHNPLGALMAYALWALLIAIALTGMATYAGLLPGEEAGEELHEFLANLAFAAIVVHVAGVLIESWHSKVGLVRAMITGTKEYRQP